MSTPALPADKPFKTIATYTVGDHKIDVVETVTGDERFYDLYDGTGYCINEAFPIRTLPTEAVVREWVEAALG